MLACAIITAVRLALLAITWSFVVGAARAGDVYLQTNLVSNQPGRGAGDRSEPAQPLGDRPIDGEPVLGRQPGSRDSADRDQTVYRVPAAQGGLTVWTARPDGQRPEPRRSFAEHGLRSDRPG